MCTQCRLSKAQMRERWIKLHLEQGLTIKEVVKLSGYHRNTLSLWKSKYQSKGVAGLIDEAKTPHQHLKEMFQNQSKSLWHC
jgi:transposase